MDEMTLRMMIVVVMWVIDVVVDFDGGG